MFKRITLFMVMAFVNISVYSETLTSALSHAYTNNPIINSKRAELRSLDENVSAASSQFFPSIEVMGSYSENSLKYGDLDKVTTNPLVGSVSVNQKIFTGGRLISDRLSAVNLVAAGRQSLRDSEQNILFLAAKVYFNYLKTKNCLFLHYLHPFSM